jgi:hypothetical protein
LQFSALTVSLDDASVVVVSTDPRSLDLPHPSRYARHRKRRAAERKNRMTVSEYFATPEQVRPQELVYGVMRVQDAPLVPHQRILFRFALALHAYLERTAEGELLLAPVDVVLDRERALVVQPDAAIVTRERSSIVQDRIYGAPDIASRFCRLTRASARSKSGCAGLRATAFGKSGSTGNRTARWMCWCAQMGSLRRGRRSRMDPSRPRCCLVSRDRPIRLRATDASPLPS